MTTIYSLSRIAGFALLAIVLVFAFTTQALATTNCVFNTWGSTMYLAGDCMTDETIFVPDGMTLHGQNYTITAHDPVGDHFRGAVVKNAGSVAHVRNLYISADNLTNVCDAGGDRLRGIMFEGASGSINDNAILALNQGPSGCQEGNGIEVRNAPFDGTHPNTKTVELKNNAVLDYQKTGIVANGDVSVTLQSNLIDESISQPYGLAANGIQLGFGAYGNLLFNRVGGNQWCGPSNFAATAFLMFQTGGPVGLTANTVSGNSDVGMYLFGDNMSVFSNTLYDFDFNLSDCNVNGYDIGIGNYGSNNTLIGNTIVGFDTPYDPPLTTFSSLTTTSGGEDSGNARALEKTNKVPFDLFGLLSELLPEQAERNPFSPFF